GQHISTNVFIQYKRAITHFNLKRSLRDQVILNRQADEYIAKEIKLKLLALFNEQNNRYIRDDQEDQTAPLNSLHHYYQLTAKAFFVYDFEENWISQEWILGFIDTDKIKFKDNKAQEISKMIKKLVAKHIVPIQPDYYLVNYIT
ncbi:1887_t:CDS:2, partial [Racocetra persica]